MQVSVIICTFNGAQRFPAVIDRLVLQTEPHGFEIILVDNNSTDDTAAVFRKLNKMHSDRLNYILEKNPGQSHAREAGARAASGEILAFVDDDNLVSDRWVKNVTDFFNSHPAAGLVGSRVINEIPPSIRQRIGFGNGLLGEVDFGPEPRRIFGDSYEAINGAGMALKRIVWKGVAEEKLRLRGRTGTGLTAGEDRELMYRVLLAGHEVWYNPAMLIQHQIEPRRLNDNYLARLAFASGTAQPFLRKLKKQLHKNQHSQLTFVLADALRVLRHACRARGDVNDRLLLRFYAGSLRGIFN